MIRPLLAAAILALFAIACSPRAQPVTIAKRGVATHETWVALEQFGTKVRVPNGWEFKRRDAVIASVAREERGAWFMAGTADRAEATERLSIGFAELRIELGTDAEPLHDIVVHGISFARQDFVAARVRGKPARVIVLAADRLPKGEGYLVFIGYAHTDDHAVTTDLDDTIASLSPN